MATMAMEFLPRPARRWIGRNRRSGWKGLVAGAAGGLLGTIAMTQFQKVWQKAGREERGFGDNRQQRENAEPEARRRATARGKRRRHDEGCREACSRRRHGAHARTARRGLALHPLWIRYSHGRPLGHGHGDIAARHLQAASPVFREHFRLGAVPGRGRIGCSRVGFGRGRGEAIVAFVRVGFAPGVWLDGGVRAAASARQAVAD